MGAQKKFQNHYPVENKQTESEAENTLQDKREIEAYLKKISGLLERDPELQKKAALLISEMMKKR
ncbi:MAG: hypothetical protein CME62_09025 [Halobacteriovoraceae bacterium]|nr:hypothetical protein [Halobacteriovoraceae bacterium]|tara:strand:- start:6987 stop:7181 length:195 start_codon:yes stop_codon:yes gene_type:complete